MQTIIRSLCALSTALFFSQASIAQCTSTIINFPYTESFEDGFGDWTGDISNPGWQQTSNGTNSGGTGPSSAFDGTDYVYSETSQGATGVQNTTYELNGPCFDLPTNTVPYISFHYHMYTSGVDADMGWLYLLADVDASGTFDTLWSKFGDQGNAWLTDTVDLSTYSGQSVRLSFVALTGSSGAAWRGDRAIDNLFLSTGLDVTNETCLGNDGTATVRPFFSLSGSPSYTISWPGGPTQSSVQEGTKTNISPGSYTVTITDNLNVQKLVDYTVDVSSVQNIDELPHVVDFETGYGGWFNIPDDDFDWLAHQGATSTATTGPTGAAEGSRYLYTEANYSSSTNGGPQLADNDVGIIESPCYTIPSTGAPYFGMRYHMRAATASEMGELFVRVQEVGTSTWDTIFSDTGNVSTSWQTLRQDLSDYQGDIIRLQIIGQLGDITTVGGNADNDGDRAIDRIVVSNGVEVTDESCPSAGDGSLTAYAAFSGGATTYLWSNSATTQTISNLTAGTYTVTITSNPNVRVVQAEVGGIEVPSTPSIVASATTICDNSQDTIDLSVGYPDNTKNYEYYSRALFSNVGPVQDTVHIQDPPKNPVEDLDVRYYYHGDINFEPSQFEILKLQDENNVTLIDSLQTTYQAWRNMDSAHTTISISSWEDYAEDGLVVFRGVPNGNVNVAGLGHGIRWRAYVEFEFDYTDFKPYWFTSATANTPSTAIDSGYTLSVSPTTTTTYYVRYIDQECGAASDADSVTISVSLSPIVSISPSNPFYCSSPVTITASGASSYVWSPGTGLNQTTGSSVNASPANTSSYSVIGTNASGCSDTVDFNVTVSAGPSVTTTSTNVGCNGGNDGSITAIPSGGTGGYTYSWSNGDTSATINNLIAGTYTVTVNDSTSCEASTTVTITEPAAISITMAGNNIGCSGFSTGSAFAFVTGGTGGYSYLWSNGSTSNVVFALAAGTYTVTVTDGNGCTASDDVTITEPSSALTSSISSTTPVSCFGGNDGAATAAGSGGTPGYTYSWSNGGNTATVTGLSAGNYIVTVVDANGCQSVSIATITQPSTAVSVSINSSVNVSCSGGNDGSASASASGGTGSITYAWSNGSNTSNAAGLSAGTYTVTATDANGCTDTASVTITEPAAVTASFSTASPSCNGGANGSITATGSGGDGGPYSYAWNNGGTSATITGLSAGTYTVTITDNSGCTGTESTMLTEPTLLVGSVLVDQNVSCNGGNDGQATASATGGTSPYSFAWSSGGTTATETGLAAGTYTVTITDDNGCTDTETVTITEPTLLVASAVVDQDVSCFGGNDGEATASATGGTSPYSFSWSSGGTTATETGLTAGTYTVTVTDDNGCTDTESITITEPATAVAASITGSTNVSCSGGNDGTATASATGGTSPYSFAWSSGGTTATETGLAAGTYTVTITDDNGCTDTETVTITEPAALVASTVVDQDVSCNGGSDGEATAAATGGTSPYSFAWSSGGTAATETGLSAGTYTVTVTDDNGCTDTETVTITEPAALIASAVVDQNISCNGGNDGQATANATGGTSPYSFAWSSGGTTATETGLAAGTYTVTITDDNGCTDTETVTITEPTLLVATAVVDQDVSCFGGNDGEATASATGGTSPYSFSWSSGGTAATETGLMAGTYTVTITDDNGCTDTESITITEPATAVAASITGSTNVSCSGGNDGSATASATGGTSPYSFAWSSGGTTSNETGLTAGTYTVTVTDDNGCTDTETVTITEPAALIASTVVDQDVSCNGGSDGEATAAATGGTSPYSFAWSSGGTAATETGLSAGTYTVTVTDDNGCTDTETATITEPAALIASTVVDQNISCNGGNDGQATANATGGTTPYSFAWSSGGTTATETGLAAGTYTVTVTDDNGCTDTETVTITEPTLLVASAVVDQDVSCFGGSDGEATASATGGTSPYSFSWSSGGTAATETGLTAGTYTVTVTDDNGCTDTETVTITEPATAVAASITGSTDVSCSGGNDGSATASATGGTSPYSFSWSSGGTTSNETGLTAGTYTVTVTDDNGCTDTETVTITEPAALVASTVIDQDVSCNGGSDGEATASATGGTSPYSFSWSSGGTTATETGLSAGTYTVTVTDDNGCTDTASVIITEPTLLVASTVVDQDVSCNGGNDGQATANATGGTSPYSFAWSSGGTTATETGLAAGTYTVTITDDNGCTDTETVTITEPTLLVASIDSSSNVSCFGGNDGEATASATGGTSPYSFSWSSGGTAATETGLMAGTYTVTITDDNGCTDTETVTITEPATAVAASITGSTNVSCSGGNDGSATASATGGISPYSFAWSSGGTSANETALTAGTYTVTVTDDNGCTDTASVIITEPTLLIASTVVDQNVSCNGGSDGEATAAATGGTSPYTFAWSSGGTAATETGLAAGTYTVTVTDDNGCTDTASVIITEPTLLVASTVVDQNISCNGGNDGEATASATGGTTPYSFSWSSGGTAANETGLSAGTYTVTVTDDNGCTDTETVTITEPTLLVASIDSSSNVSCFGLFDGSAHASASGGTAPYSFLWSSGANTASATGLGASTFTVTVTDDNGCTDTAQVTITEPGQLDVTAVVDSNVLCNGGANGQATATGSSGTAPYSFSWSNGGNSATASNLTVGTYTVTITDDAGCTDTTSVTITEPTLLVASTVVDQDVSCNGGSDGEATAAATGGTSPYSFAWSSGATTATATNLTAGTYTVTVTDDNGCSDTASVTITEPTALTLNVSVVDVSCFGAADGSLTANAAGGSAPYTYLWSNASTMMTITSMSPGTYNVTVTDDNGCTVTGSGTITQPVALSASISVDSNVSCNGGSNASATASGSGGTAPFSFAWSSGATTATAANLAAGSYTVTITDDNGCTDTATATITEPSSLVTSISVDDSISCNGADDGVITATATGGTGPLSFNWSTGDMGSTLDSLSAGTFTVTVTDANGCSDTASINLTEPDTLTVTVASLTDVSCFGGNDGSVSVTGVGGTLPYAFDWSNAGVSDSIGSLTIGTYTVTLTDANGCTSAIAAVVQEPDSISNSFASSNVTCNGNNDGWLVANPSGGTNPYSFAWSNLATSDSIGGLSAGSYTVTVSDTNGCSNSFSLTITEPTALTAQIIVEDSIDCEGDSTGLAIAAATGGSAPFTYSWPAGFTASNDSLINLPAGSYTVTVTDINGCSDTATALIESNPAIVISIDSTLDVNCVGGNDGYAAVSAIGGVGSYGYLWPNGGTAFENDSLDAGTHCVTVSDGLGCTSTECVTLSETNSLPVFSLTADTALCDTSYLIEADSGFLYEWNTSATSQSLLVSSSGTYTVTITDSNGCEAADSITVTLFPLVSFDLTLDSSACSSNTGTAEVINLIGGGGFEYTWSNGDTNVASIDSLAVGSYAVTVADSNGCSSTDSFTIELGSALTLAFNAEDISCFNANDGFASAAPSNGIEPYSYAWSTGSVNDSIDSLSPGYYTVTLSDAAGCVLVDSVLISEPDSITFNMVTMDSDCGDSNGYAAVINLAPSSLYSFIWDDPLAQTGDTATQLPPGIYNVTITDSNACTSNAQAIVNNIGAPTLALSAQDESCFGSSDGFAAVNATGGGPFTYAWDDPLMQVTDTAVNLSGGTYFVTVSDTAGCQAIDSITVQTLFPQAILALGSDTTVCADDYLLMAPITFSSYAWNTGSVNDSVLVTASGNYILTVTDSNGCTAVDSIEITLNDPIALNAELVNSACQEDTGSITVDILSGNGGYIFNWNTGDTTSIIEDLSAGTYTLSVTDSASCSAVDTFTIIAPDAPVLSLSATDASCFGESGTINFSATGGASPYLYAWSNGSFGNPNPVGAGSYVVTLTDDSGCVVIDSIEVGEPAQIDVSLTAIASSCADSNGSISSAVSNSQGPITSYLWNDQAGSTTPNLDSIPAGLYSVSVTDSAGCTQVATIALSDSGSADLTLAASQNLCSNENTAFAAVSAIGAAPFTYLWNDALAQSSDTAFNLGNGSYAVTVIDDSGCVAIADTQITSINQAPAIDLGEDRTACNGSETILTPGGGFADYLWNTGATTPSILATISQVYGVTVTDTAGCTSTDTTIISFVDPPFVNLGPDTVVCVDDLVPTVSLSAGEGFLSYLWSTSDTTSSIQINQGGLFSVTVSNAPECFGSDQRIVVFDTCFNVSLEELDMNTDFEVTVYPNPNRGVFDVSLKGASLEQASIVIRNATGQVVEDITLEDDQSLNREVSVNMQTAPKGVYLMTLLSKGMRIDRRIVIQ